ncbi:MAG: hypothetical protein LAQ69_30955 [Acidobacteriia bacterium]|nr:hypothetical protein [Terriglobia bacterium]
MSPKNRAWLLIAILAAVCVGLIWGVGWYRGRPIGTAKLLQRMPTRDAVVVYIDFSELRRGGLLQLFEGNKASEDPDYQSFAQTINFDYRQDLDSALLAFAPSGKYMLVKGRFDWKSLRSYATASGGKCMGSTCRMTGSTPDRRISFFPLQSSLLALAVSPDDSAVLDMTGSVPGPVPEVPSAPVWLSIPGSFLRSGENLPTGTRMFARGMEKAEKVTLTFAPEGSRLAARLDVRCRNEQEAVEVASQLSSATLTLRQILEREHQKPSPTDLAGVLASGSFRSEGRSVFGYWPVERAFVETLLSGVS